MNPEPGRESEVVKGGGTSGDSAREVVDQDPLAKLKDNGGEIDLASIVAASSEQMEALRRSLLERDLPSTASALVGEMDVLETAEESVAEARQRMADLYPSTDPVRLAEAQAITLKAGAEAARVRVDVVARFNEMILELDQLLQLRRQQLELERKALENRSKEHDLKKGELDLAAERLAEERRAFDAQQAAAARARRQSELRARRDDDLRTESLPREGRAASRLERARVARLAENSRVAMAELRRSQMERLKPRLKAVAWTAAVLVPISNLIADQPEYADYFPFSVINDASDAVLEPLVEGVRETVFGLDVQTSDVGFTAAGSKAPPTPTIGLDFGIG